MLYLAEPSQEWWANPVAGPVIAGAILAALSGLAVMLRRVLRSVQRVEDHVLPHFTPPAPGLPDATVPGRLARLEQATEDVRSDLVTHMADEMAIREKDLAQRETRQEQLDKRLADGAEQLTGLKVGQAAISAKLNDMAEGT